MARSGGKVVTEISVEIINYGENSGILVDGSNQESTLVMGGSHGTLSGTSNKFKNLVPNN